MKDREKKKTSTQHTFDPQGWIDGGWREERIQKALTEREMTRPPVDNLWKCKTSVLNSFGLLKKKKSSFIPDFSPLK